MGEPCEAAPEVEEEEEEEQDCWEEEQEGWEEEQEEDCEKISSSLN